MGWVFSSPCLALPLRDGFEIKLIGFVWVFSFNFNFSCIDNYYKIVLLGFLKMFILINL